MKRIPTKMAKAVSRDLVIKYGRYNWVYDDLIESATDEICHLYNLNGEMKSWREVAKLVNRTIEPIWGGCLDGQDPAPWWDGKQVVK